MGMSFQVGGTVDQYMPNCMVRIKGGLPIRKILITIGYPRSLSKGIEQAGDQGTRARRVYKHSRKSTSVPLPSS